MLMIYYYNVMPRPHYPPPASRRAVRKLGADIRAARLRRRLPMDVVAQRAATSRMTIARIEKGDTGVGTGILAAVLQALNLLDRFENVADPSNDVVGQTIALEELPKRARMRRHSGHRDHG